MGTDYSTMSDDDLIAAGESAKTEKDIDTLKEITKEMIFRIYRRNLH